MWWVFHEYIWRNNLQKKNFFYKTNKIFKYKCIISSISKIIYFFKEEDYTVFLELCLFRTSAVEKATSWKSYDDLHRSPIDDFPSQ